jgi:serine protease Do
MDAPGPSFPPAPPSKPASRLRPPWSVVLVLVMVAAVALALGTAVVRRAMGPASVTRHASAPMSLADIFARVSPAVVSIEVAGPPGPSVFRFGQPRQRQEEGEARASGSGFFVSADGLVVTNAHVVEGARQIIVGLHDGRRLGAKVVGRDETVDLAVLRVVDPDRRGARYPFVDFEDSARPRVGDWVLAVGNPFGLGGTATAGIVSAYGRDIDAAGLVEFLQLDAAINRGDMGGPSFDIYGRVIGVNTVVLSPSGGSIGISFAIPADMAAATVKELATGKAVLRGFIGAQIQTLTGDMAAAQNLPGRKGALVAGVAQGGPAARAGLRAGDLVVAIDGQAIAKSAEITRKVARAGPGKTLKFDILREGRPRAVSVRTGTRPPPRELERAF